MRIRRKREIMRSTKLLIILSIFLISSSLTAQWARTYGTIADDIPRSIIKAIDEGYIIIGNSDPGTGYNYSVGFLWIMKISEDGTILWQQTIKPARDNTYGGAYDIRITKDHGYIMVGRFESMVGYYEGWDVSLLILKLTKNGDIEWHKEYGGSGYDKGLSVLETDDNGYMVAGTTLSFGAGRRDAWILKLDSQGDIEWQKTYGGADNDGIQDIVKNNNHGYSVVGSTQKGNNFDFLIMKIGLTGEIVQQWSFGGKNQDNAYSQYLSNDGLYFIAGSTRSFGYQNDNVLIIMLKDDKGIENCVYTGTTDLIVSNTNIVPTESYAVMNITSAAHDIYDIEQGLTFVPIQQLCLSGKKKGKGVIR